MISFVPSCGHDAAVTLVYVGIHSSSDIRLGHSTKTKNGSHQFDPDPKKVIRRRNRKGEYR